MSEAEFWIAERPFDVVNVHNLAEYLDGQGFTVAAIMATWPRLCDGTHRHTRQWALECGYSPDALVDLVTRYGAPHCDCETVMNVLGRLFDGTGRKQAPQSFAALSNEKAAS